MFEFCHGVLSRYHETVQKYNTSAGPTHKGMLQTCKPSYKRSYD